MRAANIRHEVISNNIANINTPYFKRSSVEFEDLLALELYGEEPTGKMPLVKTHRKHLPTARIPDRAEPQIILDNSTNLRVDRNNVDVDIEMASMAKNQLYYNALARQLGGHISSLKNVIASK